MRRRKRRGRRKKEEKKEGEGEEELILSFESLKNGELKSTILSAQKDFFKNVPTENFTWNNALAPVLTRQCIYEQNNTVQVE